MNTGNKIIDFNDNNLHLVGYSTPINQTVTYLQFFKQHLYSPPNSPKQFHTLLPIIKNVGDFVLLKKKKITLKKEIIKSLLTAN